MGNTFITTEDYTHIEMRYSSAAQLAQEGCQTGTLTGRLLTSSKCSPNDCHYLKTIFLAFFYHQNCQSFEKRVITVLFSL